MKKYINPESAIKAVQTVPAGNWSNKRYVNEISSVPTEDVVEVVRCKECKFTKRDGTDEPAIYCQKWDRWEMPEDAYCWLGRRKEQ